LIPGMDLNSAQVLLVRLFCFHAEIVPPKSHRSTGIIEDCADHSIRTSYREDIFYVTGERLVAMSDLANVASGSVVSIIQRSSRSLSRSTVFVSA